MRRSLLSAGVAALLVLLAGCGAEEPVAAPSPEPTARRLPSGTDEPSEVASTRAEDSPSPAETMPEPDPGPTFDEVVGRDWQQVAQQLLDIQGAAYRRRDIGLLIEYAKPVCACYDYDREAIQSLLDNDRRRDTERPPVVTSAEVWVDDVDAVTLRLQIDRATEVGTEANGDEFGRLEAEVTSERWTLISDDGSNDGPWRVAIIRREFGS